MFAVTFSFKVSVHNNGFGVRCPTPPFPHPFKGRVVERLVFAVTVFSESELALERDEGVAAGAEGQGCAGEFGVLGDRVDRPGRAFGQEEVL